MSIDDYFYRRAQAELEMARRAADPAAAKLHHELAGRYFDRFYALALDPVPPR